MNPLAEHIITVSEQHPGGIFGLSESDEWWAVPLATIVVAFIGFLGLAYTNWRQEVRTRNENHEQHGMVESALNGTKAELQAQDVTIKAQAEALQVLTETLKAGTEATRAAQQFLVEHQAEEWRRHDLTQRQYAEVAETLKELSAMFYKAHPDLAPKTDAE